MYLPDVLGNRRVNLSLLRFSAAVLAVLVFSAISLLAQDILGTSTSAGEYKPKMIARPVASKPKQITAAKAKTPVRRKTTTRTKQPEADDTATENYFKIGQKCAKEDTDCQIENYTKAIEANDEDFASYFYRGMAYNRAKRYEEAIADYSKATELNPSEPGSYNNRAYIYITLKEYDLAIKDFTKYIEFNPKETEAYINIAESYIAKKNFPEALRYYNLAIPLSPNDGAQYSNRGYVYVNLDKEEEAFKDYTKAIELNPNSAIAYGNRGNSYFRMGKYEAAVQDYNKAIEINQKDAGLFSSRANAYSKLNLTSLADADNKRAAALQAGTTENSSNNPPLTGATAELRDVISQFANSFFAGDKTKIDQMLAREFSWRRISGEVLSSQQVLGFTTANEQFLSHSINNFKVLIESPDSTVVSYNETVTMKDGTTTADRVTAALAKREGRWQIVSLTFYSQ